MKRQAAREHSGGAFYFIANYLCLDFINTEAADAGGPVNLLTDLADVMAWLVEAKVIETGQAREIAAGWSGRPEADAAVAEALKFRAVLRRMIERLAGGAPAPAAAIVEINARLNSQVRRAELRRVRGGFEKRIHAAFAAPEHLMSPVAESACDLLCYGDFSRIRKCENQACVLYFYDTTKNHSRRWCSMSACGNRMKAAAHYRRVRAASR